MSLLEVYFPTANGALKFDRPNSVADFEDIIRLKFPAPPQCRPGSGVRFDLKQNPAQSAESEIIPVNDEIRSFQSSIVPFR